MSNEPEFGDKEEDLPQPGTAEAGTPGWIYGLAAMGILETGIILIWLALRWMPAGW